MTLNALVFFMINTSRNIARCPQNVVSKLEKMSIIWIKKNFFGSEVLQNETGIFILILVSEDCSRFVSK